LTGTGISTARAAATECAAIVTARIIRYPLIADPISTASEASASIAATRTSAIVTNSTSATHASAIAGATNSASATNSTRVAVAEVAGLLLPAYVAPGVSLAILH